MALDVGWSRIGRSGSADIRLDDPTVSRRHAVVVRTPEGELRVLDDRSMNGIMVNGEGVDWSPLHDGDSLQVGRYLSPRDRDGRSQGRLGAGLRSCRAASVSAESRILSHIETGAGEPSFWGEPTIRWERRLL